MTALALAFGRLLPRRRKSGWHHRTYSSRSRSSLSSSALSDIVQRRNLTSSSHSLDKASDHLLRLSKLDKEADHVEAREWVERFKVDDIPKDAYEVSRSRSSGPGGQHVNKTESKITLRCNLSRAKGVWLPPFVFQPLTKVPHYIPSPPSLQISSQQSRKAYQNLSSTLTLLHGLIARAAESVIVNPTSEEQKARVRGFVRKENERRLEGKKRAAMKRASRRDTD
ncbi:hypothetical protein I316_06229 [Kwoniella heveanensis BCC8398]|uniref:Prokaryotic-type class I peptide chain release factors domain-containing protein n=1 Tax=Kwoniella heveanensis BCC8398 TaxID=1296120 RepID=A0A1B9GM50_9TREE|nr:hypothetical protein I316_06229 [Kwoniella heveanensis BCC8398]